MIIEHTGNNFPQWEYISEITIEARVIVIQCLLHECLPGVLYFSIGINILQHIQTSLMMKITQLYLISMIHLSVDFWDRQSYTLAASFTKWKIYKRRTFICCIPLSVVLGSWSVLYQYLLSKWNWKQVIQFSCLHTSFFMKLYSCHPYCLFNRT